MVNADRAMTSSTPAVRAASIKAVCTCDTNPSVGIEASAASSFIAVTVPSGSVRVLFRSKITREGLVLRISAIAASDERTTVTGTPSWLAAVRIFDVNMRSSSTAKITKMILIETQAVGPFFKNGFVVACENTREAAIIDPGDEVAGLIAFVKRRKLVVRHILLTHAHVDHVTGVPAAKREFGAPVYLHRDDLFLYEAAAQQGAMFGVRVDPLPPVDVYYTRGEVITFGDVEARPHHTPGHCPGGVCLQVGTKGTSGDDLFVGDTLFAGSIGRTDLPGGDYATLMRTITSVLFAFGDDARVYPGHGPATTIGQERRTNPFLVAQTEDRR
jgi:hydroxyacylglutathione hydrolase